jgi:nitrite reductase/ring-hydroxylating ferredoxin subunit
MNRIKLYGFVTLLALQFVGCDDTYRSSIPDFPVQLNLDLATTYPTFRNSYNKYIVFEKKIRVTDYIGYGGILVYSGFDGGYYAFDMSCPYEVKPTIKVRPNDKGQAICDSCKTVFDISYGIGNPVPNPLTGKAASAKEALRRYKAVLSGDYLYVTR